MRANLTIIMLDDYFNFLLPTDHEFEHRTRLVVQSYKDVDNEIVGCNIYFSLRDFSTKIVTNPFPSEIKPRLSSSSASDVTPSIHILKCIESDDRYELDVSLRGFTINSPNGKPKTFCKCFNVLYSPAINL